MDYAMAMNYIEEKNKLGSVPGLENIKELLHRLGDPQDQCRCLQIAGTNGKGSVFSFVQEILLESGHTVGRYISPTIFTYLERFQINKCSMGECEFAELLGLVAEKVKEMEQAGLHSPTAFEIETAVAFLYFARHKVDYALIECGMGGKLDATNVIAHPVMSVIASVSRDHMQFLGEKLTEIAEHKAGIIKENSLCITAPQEQEVIRVLRDVCAQKKTELICVDEAKLKILNMDMDQTIFSYRGQNYTIKLLGEHQIINAAVAIEVAGKIGGVGLDVIKRGLYKTEWRGRMTRVCETPDVFVDGAHNEAAWKYLQKAVNKYFTNRKIIYIIGVLKDKEYKKMVDILAETMSYAIAVTPDTPRALDKKLLAEEISQRGIGTSTACSVDDAVQQAMYRVSVLQPEGTGEDAPVILVCGSLSFIAEYLEYNWQKYSRIEA